MLIKPNILNVINSPERIPAIDVLRALAAIAVVLFHFEHLLPFGNSGVYLFFVISGFLVGGILVRKFLKEDIKFSRFILERGFKIWPSYFVFLAVGSSVAYLIYSRDFPHAYIPLKESARYIFFVRNYTGAPDHWNFDHVWTLCIEEHFYVILPAAFLILLMIGKPTLQTVITFSITLAIASVVSKVITYFYFPDKPITTPTHNTLDGFAYGIIIFCYKEKKIIFPFATRILALTAGCCLLIGLAIIQRNDLIEVALQNVLLGILSPLAFGLITFGVLEFKFRKLYFLRIISFYSYNLYLWHLLFYYPIVDHFGIGLTGFSIYLVTAIILAFVFTHLVEQPFMRLRYRLYPKVKIND